jgi:hypothetical protein
MAITALPETDTSSVTGVLGFLAGTGFLALWQVEKQAKAVIDAELQLVKSQAAEAKGRVSELEAELQREKDLGKDLTM